MAETSDIQLAVREFYSPDVDIHSWTPESVRRVYFLVELEIGEVGTEGADLFQVIIATPEGLLGAKAKPVISDRGTIILHEYSWPLARRTIEHIVERCRAPTWVDSVLRLQRYFRWEYEDYTVA